MEELKPCPFCGGEALLSGQKGVDNLWFGAIECQSCEATIEYFAYSPDALERRLTEAWNTRYEPTCTMEYEELVPPLHLRKWTCSRCGGWWMRTPNNLSAVHYCPGCGARVVDGGAL